MDRRLMRAFVAATMLGLVLFTAGCREAGTPEPSPNDSSSADLVESPKKYDGTQVTFAGEAIGEAMVRGDMAWLHVNDDPYYLKNVEEGAQLGGYNSGMAIWIPAGEADAITYFGDYEHEGDIVEVAGVFNAACAQHGGDMDIHATSLDVLEPGHVVIDEIKSNKVIWAAGLALVALALYIADRRWRGGWDSTRR